jgi:dTDP-4-amino-4,6-dideoxygalactose transaminase
MYRIGKEEIEAISKVIESRYLFRVGGPLNEVEAFERELAAKVGTRHALCVNGGTTALICGLVGLGVGPGDEVLIPGYTFMATATAVLAVGAIPVIAEVDESLCLDPADVEKKLGPRTRAVIPVHMVGFPCDLDPIGKAAAKHGARVLEDACQADGGSYRGKRLGSIGHAGAFSFNFYKIISSGEGGGLVTDDPRVYERALVHHDGGAAFRPYAKDLSEPPFTGQQYRVGELLGAVLRVQLRKLDPILADLRKVKRALMGELQGAFRFVPSNDAEGDCGTTLGFRFDTEAQARAFAKAEGVGGWLPIDSGRHVYSNWEPVLAHRGAHHPALNPFLMRENKGLRMEYAPDMCPRTLEHLKRSVYLSLHPDWDHAAIAAKVAACRKARP